MKWNYLKKVTANVLIALLAVLVMVGCEKTDPISANVPATQKSITHPAPNFLKLKNQKHSFNKPIEVRQWISATSGGQLVLQ
ncbi:MAG: hypothetical protein D6732_05365, partial [Methanobacteriota archaeon]